MVLTACTYTLNGSVQTKMNIFIVLRAVFPIISTEPDLPPPPIVSDHREREEEKRPAFLSCTPQEVRMLYTLLENSLTVSERIPIKLIERLSLFSNKKSWKVVLYYNSVQSERPQGEHIYTYQWHICPICHWPCLYTILYLVNNNKLKKIKTWSTDRVF